jgi:YgiT-type zinc finger domain-containing protein
MRCTLCRGKMTRGFAPFHIDRKGYHLSIDAVPARVCSQCGDPYFEEREVETIQQLLTQLDQHTARMTPAAA